MTIVIILLILNFALLGGLGFAVWIIAHDDRKMQDWSEPLEPIVIGEVVDDAEQ